MQENVIKINFLVKIILDDSDYQTETLENNYIEQINSIKSESSSNNINQFSLLNNFLDDKDVSQINNLKTKKKKIESSDSELNQDGCYFNFLNIQKLEKEKLNRKKRLNE